MSAAALLLALAAGAAAQSGLYGFPSASQSTAPAAGADASASTATVAASTEAAKPEEEGRGVKVAEEAPKPKLERPLRATIHKEAAEWEPVGLKVGGDPFQAATAATVRVVKVKGRMKGANMKATASARTYPGRKGSSWLTIAVRPRDLEKRRVHLEVRLRLFEGFVEEAVAAAVRVTDRRAGAGRGLDARALRDQAVEFIEETAGSGLIVVSALDPRARKDAFNAGRLEKAEFADPELGFVNLSWSVKGVAAAK